MSQKVLFVNPGRRYYGKTDRRGAYGSIGLPIGILYAASTLKKKGCDISVIDSLVHDETKLLKNHEFTLCGIPLDRLADLIRRSAPDIIAIATHFYSQEETVIETVRLARSVCPNALIVVGGANASVRGLALMTALPEIDIVVKGEGEAALGEFADIVNRGEKDFSSVRGLFVRSDGSVVDTGDRPFIEDLDSIPLPDYRLLDMERYLTLYQKGVFSRDRGVERNINIVTSRGCPYRCTFCSIGLSMGFTWRAHSAAYVSGHIEYLSREYRVRHIHFEDDNLLHDPERFIPVMDTLKRERMTWDTPNGVRVDLALDENYLRRVKESGSRELRIGVETGDEGVMRSIRKGLRLEDVEELARRCRVVGLPLKAFFILGFPEDTLRSMKKTIGFALRLFDRYGVEAVNLIAAPLVGTEMYATCAERGYFRVPPTPRALSETIAPDGNCLIETERFKSTDVERLSRAFYRAMFLRKAVRYILDPRALFKKRFDRYAIFRIASKASPRAGALR